MTAEKNKMSFIRDPPTMAWGFGSVNFDLATQGGCTTLSSCEETMSRKRIGRVEAMWLAR